MSTTGQSAHQSVTVSGATPSTQGQAAPLLIDSAGDALLIDPAGDPLLIQAGVTWTGQSASQTV